MKRFFTGLLLVCLISFASCDLWLLSDDSISDDDIVIGIKTALEVGADSSVFVASKVDGYYSDPAIKFFLPEEAQPIVDNIDRIPNGQSLLKNVILSMNRAAEDAAISANPILKKAITDMAITDGHAILNGINPMVRQKSTSDFDSTAATNYLIAATYNHLVTIFSDPINQSLNKPLLDNFSANKAWNDLLSAYNAVADKDVLNFHKVNVNFGLHVTQKALDGLFRKVGDQERIIRRDPWKWVTNDVGEILTKVFGD